MGLVRSVALHLQGETRIVGELHNAQLMSTPVHERILQRA